jgi:hypothetical protein
VIPDGGQVDLPLACGPVEVAKVAVPCPFLKVFVARAPVLAFFRPTFTKLYNTGIFYIVQKLKSVVF